jgi:hypothetical protein
MNFSLQNLGTLNTANLIATLLTTNGVTSPSGAQSYGALSTNGNIVTLPFTFTASGVCGGTVQPTFTLTDGATNLGMVSFTIPLGAQSTFLTENFDGVTAPALPVGWSTTAGGGQSAWVTTTTQRDTLPNAAYSTDAASAGSNELVSAVITLPSGASQLTFKHRYELESGSGVGYDGGVLEIKIGAGAFTDIVDAGGSFASGGYNNTLSTGYSNPLGGRSAWSGTNATFTSVVVNLPASAAGQNVQFRWRCGSDSSVSKAGWWVDSASISGSVCCTGPAAPTIQAQPQSLNVIGGAPANFSVTAAGTGTLAYQWYFNSNGIPGATATNYSIAVVNATNGGNYFVVVSNNIGATTSSLATLTVVLAPIVTQQPSNQTVQVGLPANFSVTAIGAPTLAYQWRKNSNNIAGANSANYPLASVTAGDAGYYDVIVTNNSGSVTSGPALLTVVNPVAFSGVLIGWDMNGLSSYGPSPMAASTNAPNTTVTAGLTRGSGFTLSGTAAGGAWGGNGLNTASAAAAITAGDFATFSLKANVGYAMSITNLSRFDYRRSGTTSANVGLLQYSFDGTIFTDITNISFSSSGSGGTALTPIDLSTVAALQNIPPGTNVTFRLVLYGGTSSTANWYIFQRTTSASPYELEFSGNLAPVNGAQLGPVIVQQPTSTNLLQGGSATFAVTATGSGSLTYQWSKNSAAIAAATNASLTLTNITMFNAGNYSVVVSNLYGFTNSSVVVLTVTNVFGLPVDNGPGFSGGENLFATNASGGVCYVWSTADVSQPVSAWTFEGATVEFPIVGTGISRYGITVTPATSPVYYIFAQTNTGPYTASEPVGRLSTIDFSTFDVLSSNVPINAAGVFALLAPPVITVQPAPTNVFAGNKAGFKVTATGSGPLAYQWLKGGVPVVNGGVISGALTNGLNFIPAATNHSGNYSVIVTNAGGSVTSSIAALNVVPVPALVLSNTAGGFVLMAGSGAASNSYIVQRATNLAAPIIWVPLFTNVIGTNGVIQFNETNKAAPFQFYRVVFP